MAKAPVKRTAKPKAARPKSGGPEEGMPNGPVEAIAAVEDPVGAPAAPERQVPAEPQETEASPEDTRPAREPRAERESRPQGDGKPRGNGPAVTINIAKLQAMSMTELNHMAKEMGIEN